MAGYGILRGQKVHTGGLKGIEIHNHRTRPSRSNPDIERKRSVENYSLLDEGQESLNKRVNARCQELSGGKKIRSDAVKMYDFIATASPEEMKKLSNSQQRQYFEDTRDFLIRKFGRENLMYGVVHMDEKTPHAHFGIVPEYQGRLCAKKLFTPSSLRKLQDDYYREVSSRYGLERGEVDSKRKHVKTQDFKQQTAFNGKEKDNLKELEKVIKERPVTTGFFEKEVVGYQISPQAADELIRLARVGGQAADERDRADQAEQEKEKALEREKAANAEAARLRLNNEDLQNEISKKEKELLGSKKSAEIWDRAPEHVKEDLRAWEHQYSHENECMMAFVGRVGARQGVEKAEKNPLVGMCCRELGARTEDEQKRMIRDFAKICKHEKKPEKEQPWQDKASARIFEKTMQQIKQTVEAVAQQLRAQGLEAAAMKYIEEHQEVHAEPWETLTEQRKDEIRAKTRYIDEY